MTLSKDIYDHYLDALLQGNRRTCMEIVQDLLDAEEIEARDLYEQLFRQSMYRVGELWENNLISVATEHTATSITETLLSVIYPLLDNRHETSTEEGPPRKAAVTCVPGEFHQIGARMVADIFELNGWRCYLLGANTPANSLHVFIEHQKINLLAISISLAFNMERLYEMLDALQETLPDLPILVGGQAFRWHEGGLPEHYKKKVVYLAGLEDLESYLRDYG